MPASRTLPGLACIACVEAERPRGRTHRQRITIAFTVSAERVTILRLFYGGRDWESLIG